MLFCFLLCFASLNDIKRKEETKMTTIKKLRKLLKALEKLEDLLDGLENLEALGNYLLLIIRNVDKDEILPYLQSFITAHTCPYCGEIFLDDKKFNEHIKRCKT